MKFTAPSSELQKTLSIVSGVVPARSTMPILENILFELTGNSLRISATDLEVSMSVRMDVKGDRDGAVAIPARRLIDTVRSLPDVDLTFAVSGEDQKISMKTSSGSYSLIGQPAAEFPTIQTGMNGKKVRLAGAELKRMIAHTIFCVSQDELRPAMTGVLFQFRDTEMKVVATDGHRLVRLRYANLPSTGLKQDIIVPAKALHIVLRSLGEEETVLTVDPRNVQFSLGNATLTSRLIEETYPNYESVIPLDNDKTLTVNRDMTLSSVRRVSLYSSSTTHQIRFSVKKNVLEIGAVDIDFGGEANETLPCEYDSADLDIGFNSRYVTDVLSHMEGESISFKLSNPVRAAIITASGLSEDDLLMLIMPMRLNY